MAWVGLSSRVWQCYWQLVGALAAACEVWAFHLFLKQNVLGYALGLLAMLLGCSTTYCLAAC